MRRLLKRGFRFPRMCFWAYLLFILKPPTDESWNCHSLAENALLINGRRAIAGAPGDTMHGVIVTYGILRKGSFFSVYLASNKRAKIRKLNGWKSTGSRPGSGLRRPKAGTGKHLSRSNTTYLPLRNALIEKQPSRTLNHDQSRSSQTGTLQFPFLTSSILRDNLFALNEYFVIIDMHSIISLFSFPISYLLP